eukprot:395886-Prorocentrum_minimum.AAC.2
MANHAPPLCTIHLDSRSVVGAEALSASSLHRTTPLSSFRGTHGAPLLGNLPGYPEDPTLWPPPFTPGPPTWCPPPKKNLKKNFKNL